MASYSDLVEHTIDNRDRPIELAKSLVSWIWSSLLPGGYGITPKSAQEVPELLNASCGWRDVLLKSLFSEIGIESRRVNFYDVPFQGGHTATELKINGKWIFFDSTFGLYFESLDGKSLLSIADARANWPNVVIKQSTLTGWQGSSVSLESINVNLGFADSYSTIATMPHNLNERDDIVAGEFNSLFFGSRAAYYVGGKNTYIEGNRIWKRLEDSKDTKNWNYLETALSISGRLDVEYGRYDNGDWFFKDWDQANVYIWNIKTTYITSRSVLDYEVIIYDDLSKFISNWDDDRAFNWSRIDSVFDSNGRITHRDTLFDSGDRSAQYWDVAEKSVWSTITTALDFSGSAVRSIYTMVNNINIQISWTLVNQLTGSQLKDILLGSDQSDYIEGYEGNDTLIGHQGTDLLKGGRGNDTYYLDDPLDLIVEEVDEGIDITYSSVSIGMLFPNVENIAMTGSALFAVGNELDNTIYGNSLNNQISGALGDDKLFGRDGDDLLAGNRGKDFLVGNGGKDLLYGGQGSDLFRFQGINDSALISSRADVIMDFHKGDRIDLSAIDANSLIPGNQSFQFIGSQSFSNSEQLRFFTTHNQTKVVLNTDTTNTNFEFLINLVGIHVLDKSDFIL
jgi:Ca2+-binding RTX toxin-like protein